MGWRIVSIQESEKLSLYLDNLMIHTSNGKQVIPLSDIDALMIENLYTSFTTKLGVKLTEYKILTLLCDDKMIPSSILLPLHGYVRQHKRLIKQLCWEENDKKSLWDKIVIAKTNNQLNFMKGLEISDELILKLGEYQDDIINGDEKNREGTYSKIYFPVLFGESFTRELICPINAALNYGYTILLAYFVRCIIGRGYLFERRHD